MKRGRVHRARRRRGIRSNVSESVTCDFKSDSHVYQNLLRWMGTHGFKHSKKLKPYVFEDTGRGLQTKETIYSGDVVISVPENLLIKPLVILESYLGPYIKRYCPDATGQEILSLFMMCEKAKGEMSIWYPYIATLPSSYTIPAYCNDSTAGTLPVCIRDLVLRQVNIVRNSFEKLNKVITSLENSFPEFYGIFQYDLYLWAWSSVNTRCIYLDCKNLRCKGKSCSYHLALSPFLDLLNHHYDAQVKAGFNKEKRCYEIISLKHFKKHSQVFINYGNHCNWQLFKEYGFVLENNFNDIIPVSVDDILSACKSINFNEKFLQKKRMLLNHSSLLSSNIGIHKDGLTWGMDILLKICCMGNNIRNYSRVLHDVSLKEDEKLSYRKLIKAIILLKLKDLAWVDPEDLLKLQATVDSETQNLISIACSLCSVERNILSEVLQCMENDDSSVLNKEL